MRKILPPHATNILLLPNRLPITSHTRPEVSLELHSVLWCKLNDLKLWSGLSLIVRHFVSDYQNTQRRNNLLNLLHYKECYLLTPHFFIFYDSLQNSKLLNIHIFTE